MRITELTVKLGETVNLGDYSSFRPEISATVEIYPGDNVDRSMRILIRTVEEQLADLVDDALERAEKEPKYADFLFGIRVNHLRQAVVVYKKGLKLPDEKSWRDKDSWERVAGYSCPMRLDTVMGAAERVEKERGLALHLIEWQEDMDTLPGLPDPGPEPLWSQKGLKRWFEQIGVPESEWDMLAALPHVTPEHIQAVYHSRLRYSTYDKLMDGILAGPMAQADSADEEE